MRHTLKLIDQPTLEQLTDAFKHHFRDSQGYGFSLLVGYSYEVVSTTDGDLFLNDYYDTPSDHTWKICRLDDSLETFITNYCQIIKEQRLIKINQYRDRMYQLDKQLVAYD